MADQLQQQQPRNQPAAPNPNQLLYTAFQMVVVFYFFSFMTKTTTPSKTTSYSSTWALKSIGNLTVYTSEFPIFTKSSANLVWAQENIIFGDWSDERKLDTTWALSQNVRNNASLYVHAFMNSESVPTIYARKQLTRFMPRIKTTTKKNLFGEADIEEEEIPKNQVETEEPQKNLIVSYWWPNITLNIVANDDPIPMQNHPAILNHLNRNEDDKSYTPIFIVNDFWLLQDNLVEINQTTELVNVSLSFAPITQWKFQMYMQFQESFRIQTEVMGLPKSESDKMKRMFLETNPILLTITMLVSLLHSVFDFLAFKNDIEFWTKRKKYGRSFV